MAVCVNPGRAFNCYWEMPFRRGARLTLENRDPDSEAVIYWQINYALTRVPEDAVYFHAQFRRSNPLPFKRDHVVLDGVRGRGDYVGAYVAWGVNNSGWWGEGEIKFFLDGDEFPTICGTGAEDYFCGAYNFDAGTSIRLSPGRISSLPRRIPGCRRSFVRMEPISRSSASASTAGTWTRSDSIPTCGGRCRRSAGGRKRTSAVISLCRMTSPPPLTGIRPFPPRPSRRRRTATIWQSYRLSLPMRTFPPDCLDRTYAAVLGKLIGVYLGRPVENWTYHRMVR